MESLGTVWRYWRLIFGLAWKESAARLKKEAWKLGLVLVFAGVVAYFSLGFDVGRLLLTGLVSAIAFLGFLWKLVSIPARLHGLQQSSAEAREIARELERLYKKGVKIQAGFDKLGGYATWHDNVVDWSTRTYETLKRNDEAAAFMFLSIGSALPTRRLPDILPAHYAATTREKMSADLGARLNKLRLIVGRAHEKAVLGGAAANVTATE